MTEYQTVVLDREDVLNLGGVAFARWVTHSCASEFLTFWSIIPWFRYPEHEWTNAASRHTRIQTCRFPEVHDMLCSLPDEQRIARIEYRLTPEPYSEDEPTPDPVNRPSHYTQGVIECIDAIRSALAPEKSALTPEEFRGFCKGNALKYIWREKHKGGDESIRKAIWYLEAILEDKK